MFVAEFAFGEAKKAIIVAGYFLILTKNLKQKRSPRKIPGFVPLQKIMQKASCDLHDVKNMIIFAAKFHSHDS